MACFRKCFLVFCGVLALSFLLSTAASADEQTQEGSPQAPATNPSQNAADDSWHVGLTPYLWFAGVHGTVGALDRTTSVHAPFADIFKYFNIGFMGAVEARKRHLVLATDLIWMKLSDDKGLPINELGVQSIKAKMTQFVLTPKVGYRVVDREKIKVDALVGLRYWHLGTSLNFVPTLFNGVSTSANWVDVVGGAKIEVPLSPKAAVTVLGDAGGGGANIDYQVAGLLGYKVGTKCVLQAGWRYLDVNHRGSHAFIYDVATSGALLGVTFNLK